MQRKAYLVKIEPAGERRLRQIISTGSADRAGDRIPVESWRLEPFQANPVVLWGHDYAVPAIAKATSVAVQGNRLISTAEFPPPGIHPLADTVHGLLQAGILKAASVGF